jgi:hypothetical protein
MDTSPAELSKALGIYKEKYGGLASIDNSKLDEIIKDIRESKTTTQQSARSRRPRNR